MEQNFNYIRELLTKENERFHLVRLGFIKNIEKETSFYASAFPKAEDEDYAGWKHRTLKEYYRSKGFGRFCRSNINNPVFERMILTLMKSHADSLFRNEERTQTDKYLAPDMETVSYLLPEKLFQEIYGLNFCNIQAFGNSWELNDFCRQVAKNHFPMEEPRIIGELKENETAYWEKFYKKLKPIASAYCYQMSGTSGDNNTHDIWSDTCVTVNRAVVDGRMKEPIDAKAIISYAVGILKNKNREINRKRANTPADIDTLQYKLSAEDENNFFNNPITSPENFTSQSFKISNIIDISDKDMVRKYFVVILYNKEHPLHDKLIKGLEDKVERMFDHYIDGLSYEDIVEKHWGKKTGNELNRHCAQLRQEIKRLKEKLLENYYNLIEEEK